jgi:acyl-coenzyme A synthetase/AMP-(fatty) acid ligase
VSASEYEFLSGARCERGVRDAYAAFRPFNESSRLVDTLVPSLQEQLQKGGVLVLCWARTPWMACWLAVHLPQVQVFAIWEGERGIFGIDGYHYWFADRGRPENLRFVFADLRERWPFRDESVDCVHGLDALHRYGIEHIWSEAHRIAKPESPILFPHLHLGDHQPEPFFERGCDIRCRSDYYELFETEPDERRRWQLLPEASAFRAWKSGKDPCTAHFEDAGDYNGCAFGLPPGILGRAASTPVHDGASHGIVNPLVNLRGAEAVPKLDPASRELLERHPVYDQLLADLSSGPVNPRERACLSLFEAGLPLATLGELLAIEKDSLGAVVDELARRDLVRVGPFSRTLVDLQAYCDGVRHQRRAVDFAELWGGLAQRYGERTVVEYSDGSEFTMYELELLTAAVCAWICEQSDPGERIAVVSPPTPELLIVAWATFRAGRVLVPIDALLPEAAVTSRIEAAGARLVIRELGDADLRWREQGDGVEDFEGMVGRFIDTGLPELPRVDPNADAVVLFTSGTTGPPKGVRVSQRSLLHTGYSLSARFRWSRDDRLLCPESPHTMSGFRNPIVAALCSASTVYISAPGPMSTMSVRRRLALAEGRCTVATTVPAEVETWLELRAPPAARLRQISLTGYGCPESLREKVSAHFAVPVFTYYGLTETGGYCLVRDGESGSLGVEDGAAIRVVDDTGRELWGDEVGELLVCTAGMMNGYLEKAPRGSPRIEEGWLFTGDLVRRLEDGSVEHLGRRDRLIKLRSGECLSIEELETRLFSVRGVVSSRARGHGRGGGYGLEVEASGDPDELRSTLLSVIVSEFGSAARPDRIEIVESVEDSS